MNEYRIKEIVGNKKYIIQKKIIIRNYKENPNLIEKIIFCFKENKEDYHWVDLTVNGNFNGIYYTKYFDSLDEATSIVKKISLIGEVEYHELNE